MNKVVNNNNNLKTLLLEETKLKTIHYCDKNKSSQIGSSKCKFLR